MLLWHVQKIVVIYFFYLKLYVMFSPDFEKTFAEALLNSPTGKQLITHAYAKV